MSQVNLLPPELRARQKTKQQTILILGAGAAILVLLLGYYKYANFFLDSAGTLLGAHWGLGDIILPLGISFFTFTQISFLIDTCRGEAREYNLVHYGLFVTYFPHLIAGPVLHKYHHGYSSGL